jgi:hypothetical protein
VWYYRLLDIGFIVFHTAFMVFILSGWLWKRARTAHLVAVVCTAFSWGILGLWYGLGYCPCTDWHWQVREKLGDTHLPNSYVKFLLDRLTGYDWPAFWVDAVVLALFLGAAMASVVMTVRTRKSEDKMKSFGG